MYRFIATTLIVILCLALPDLASASGRVALVVGNSAYGSSPLRNPVNDASDMAAKLRKLGF